MVSMRGLPIPGFKAGVKMEIKLKVYQILCKRPPDQQTWTLQLCKYTCTLNLSSVYMHDSLFLCYSDIFIQVCKANK